MNGQILAATLSAAIVILCAVVGAAWRLKSEINAGNNALMKEIIELRVAAERRETTINVNIMPRLDEHERALAKHDERLRTVEADHLRAWTKALLDLLGRQAESSTVERTRTADGVAS